MKNGFRILFVLPLLLLTACTANIKTSGPYVQSLLSDNTDEDAYNHKNNAYEIEKDKIRKGFPYYLPKSMIKLNYNRSSKTEFGLQFLPANNPNSDPANNCFKVVAQTKYSVEPLPIIISTKADKRQEFLLKIKKGFLTKANINVERYKNGYLRHISSQTSGQLDEVIVEGAKLVGSVAGSYFGLKTFGLAPQNFFKNLTGDGKCKKLITNNKISHLNVDQMYAYLSDSTTSPQGAKKIYEKIGNTVGKLNSLELEIHKGEIELAKIKIDKTDEITQKTNIISKQRSQARWYKKSIKTYVNDFQSIVARKKQEKIEAAKKELNTNLDKFLTELTALKENINKGKKFNKSSDTWISDWTNEALALEILTSIKPLTLTSNTLPTANLEEIRIYVEKLITSLENYKKNQLNKTALTWIKEIETAAKFTAPPGEKIKASFSKTLEVYDLIIDSELKTEKKQDVHDKYGQSDYVITIEPFREKLESTKGPTINEDPFAMRKSCQGIKIALGVIPYVCRDNIVYYREPEQFTLREYIWIEEQSRYELKGENIVDLHVPSKAPFKMVFSSSPFGENYLALNFANDGAIQSMGMQFSSVALDVARSTNQGISGAMDSFDNSYRKTTSLIALDRKYKLDILRDEVETLELEKKKLEAEDALTRGGLVDELQDKISDLDSEIKDKNNEISNLDSENSDYQKFVDSITPNVSKIEIMVEKIQKNMVTKSEYEKHHKEEDNSDSGDCDPYSGCRK